MDWEDSGLPDEPHHGVTVPEMGDVLSAEQISTKGSHKSPGTLPITWLRHLPSYCPVCPALSRLTVRLTKNLVMLGLWGGDIQVVTVRML